MLILGGGLAGLAAALESGARVYEAGPVAGGVAGSRRVEGFTFDHGIHVLQTKTPAIHDLFGRLGIGLSTRRRNAMIYSHRTYTPYPFQVNTAGLPLWIRARCLWNYFCRSRATSARNYEEWIYRTLGTGYGDTFLIPYSEKFWTIHPREMTSEWTGNRVPATSTWQMLRGAVVSRVTPVGANAVFQYPDDRTGFGAIPAGMETAVAQVHLNHRATRIDTARRRVEFNDGEVEVPYDRLVSTIPLPALLRILPEAPMEIREAGHRLRHTSILVVNLGIAKPHLSDWHWVHFPEKDVSFFRISYPHNLGPDLVPPGMTSVSAEIAYSEWRPLDKVAAVGRAIQDLIRVGAIGAADPIVVQDVMDIKYGYVIYDHQRRAALRIIKPWLESVGIYPTGRYGLWAYLWSHQAILAGLHAGRRLAATRSRSEELQESGCFWNAQDG